MSRDIRLYLEDIVEAGAKVLRYTEGMTVEAFRADERTLDAVIRNLEVIGEAAKNVPSEVRARFSGVEWRKIAGLRDVLAHGYFGLEAETLWDAARNKVPALLEQVREILAVLGAPPAE